MTDLDKIVAINRQRLGLDPHDADADQRFCSDVGANERLCVYGTLRPGQENHHLMEPMNAEWTEITYPGYFLGPDEVYGYPRIAWTPYGETNQGMLATSSKFPSRWPGLDEFEGADYCRILTPVETGNGQLVANIYGFVDTTRTQLLMMDGMNVHDDRD